MVRFVPCMVSTVSSAVSANVPSKSKMMFLYFMFLKLLIELIDSKLKSVMPSAPPIPA